jgi:hypothetical protein
VTRVEEVKGGGIGIGNKKRKIIKCERDRKKKRMRGGRKRRVIYV